MKPTALALLVAGLLLAESLRAEEVPAEDLSALRQQVAGLEETLLPPTGTTKAKVEEVYGKHTRLGPGGNHLYPISVQGDKNAAIEIDIAYHQQDLVVSSHLAGGSDSDQASLQQRLRILTAIQAADRERFEQASWNQPLVGEDLRRRVGVLHSILFPSWKTTKAEVEAVYGKPAQIVDKPEKNTHIYCLTRHASDPDNDLEFYVFYKEETVSHTHLKRRTETQKVSRESAEDIEASWRRELQMLLEVKRAFREKLEKASWNQPAGREVLHELIAALNEIVAPQKGTSRADVEAVYGKSTLIGQGHRQGSQVYPISVEPYRAAICVYFLDGLVSSAHVWNQNGVEGRPLGITAEESVREYQRYMALLSAVRTTYGEKLDRAVWNQPDFLKRVADALRERIAALETTILPAKGTLRSQVEAVYGQHTGIAANQKNAYVYPLARPKDSFVEDLDLHILYEGNAVLHVWTRPRNELESRSRHAEEIGPDGSYWLRLRALLAIQTAYREKLEQASWNQPPKQAAASR